MRTLRGQFILSHLLPFVLILPLAGLVILYLIEAQIMLGELAADVEERAALIAEAAARQPDSLTDAAAARRFVADVGQRTTGQIYLLDADGDVLAAEDGATIPSSTLIAAALAEPDAVQVARPGNMSAQAEALAPVIDVNEQVIGLVGVRESLVGLSGAFGPLRRLVLLTVLGGMALGALVGLWLANRLEQPIGRTAAAVAAIAAGADDAPLPITGPRELRQLSEAVNMLSARLRALEEMRRRSFANIVHELGRPLGAMQAAVQVLRGGAADDPAIRDELLGGVQQELQAMEPLLDDLSQLHADATGRRRLDKQRVALTQWLAEILPPWREAALARGLSWVVEIPDDLAEVSIDPVRMAQVVGNLLSNAVKYTTEGGVAVSAVADRDETRLSVADTGPGIARAEQARIFEPFYRAAIPQRTTEGLGVGLTIARGLTEAHGGRLTIESAPGRGSVFTIHLPMN